MLQICRLENIEHKKMKQVSYSGKYFLSASKAYHSHLQYSFLVGDAFCAFYMCRYLIIVYVVIIYLWKYIFLYFFSSLNSLGKF